MDNGKITAVTVDRRGQAVPYHADEFVLATGGLVGKGIDSDREAVAEPLFDCHVPHPQDRYEWSEPEAFGDHAFARFGVVPDDDLRPVDGGGDVHFRNLRAAGGVLGGELGIFAYYLSVAGLALIVTVELHVFTTVRMTHWFAVVFVTMTTMASGAAWTVVRWNADRLLGTTFLSKPGMTQMEANAALSTEFVRIALAGLVAGVLFDTYFKRRGWNFGRRLREVIRR